MKKEVKEKTVKDYPSLDDYFVDKYLRKDNETIEEAKTRVKKMQAEAKLEKNKKRRKKDR